MPANGDYEGEVTLMGRRCLMPCSWLHSKHSQMILLSFNLIFPNDVATLVVRQSRISMDLDICLLSPPLV